MSRIGKIGLANRLELLAGIPKKDAELFLTKLSEIMTQELSKGTSITFHGVCTIKPTIVEEGVQKVAGKDTNVDEHLKLQVRISSELKNHFKSEVSKKGADSKKIRGIGDLFHGKSN